MIREGGEGSGGKGQRLGVNNDKSHKGSTKQGVEPG